MSIDCLLTLALGFGFAGMLATGYESAARRQLGLELLSGGPSVKAFAVVVLLMFAAPFVMLRHAVFAVLNQRTGIEFVMVTTAVAAFWSLMSGIAVVLMLQTAGILTA